MANSDLTPSILDPHLFLCRSSAEYRGEQTTINRGVEDRSDEPERGKDPCAAQAFPTLKHPLLKHRLDSWDGDAKNQRQPKTENPPEQIP